MSIEVMFSLIFFCNTAVLGSSENLIKRKQDCDFDMSNTETETFLKQKFVFCIQDCLLEIVTWQIEL